jgi:adenylate kinase family enzyme
MPKDFLQFIFINGKGGSGKDTQAELFLKEHLGKAIRISTGEIYRGARDSKGEFAKYHNLIAPYIFKVDYEGGYLPDEMIVPIVKEVVLSRVEKGKEIFIFTGFPRTEPQLTMVDEMLGELGEKFDISSHHIYYSISDETSRERARFRCELARRRGEPTRPDDEPESIEMRLKVFRKLTETMINRLAEKDRLITIDAEGTISDIETETSTRLSKERM